MSSDNGQQVQPGESSVLGTSEDSGGPSRVEQAHNLSVGIFKKVVEDPQYGMDELREDADSAGIVDIFFFIEDYLTDPKIGEEQKAATLALALVYFTAVCRNGMNVWQNIEAEEKWEFRRWFPEGVSPNAMISSVADNLQKSYDDGFYSSSHNHIVIGWMALALGDFFTRGIKVSARLLQQIDRVVAEDDEPIKAVANVLRWFCEKVKDRELSPDQVRELTGYNYEMCRGFVCGGRHTGPKVEEDTTLGYLAQILDTEAQPSGTG